MSDGHSKEPPALAGGLVRPTDDVYLVSRQPNLKVAKWWFSGVVSDSTN